MDARSSNGHSDLLATFGPGLDNLVFAVSIAEAIKAGVAGDIVEVADGQFIRSECWA
jgi:hypothetical protein